MRRILFAALAFAAVLAFAAGSSATLSWTLATANANGSTLDPATITATHIVWRRHGEAAVAGSLDVAAPAVTATVAGLDCSKFDFTAQTVVTGATSDESAPPVVYDTGVVCKPNPPGALAAH